MKKKREKKEILYIIYTIAVETEIMKYLLHTWYILERFLAAYIHVINTQQRHRLKRKKKKKHAGNVRWEFIEFESSPPIKFKGITSTSVDKISTLRKIIQDNSKKKYIYIFMHGK